MTGADLHTLAGAYALGALDDAERDAFERHLADCESCAVEVAEFRATGARLALAASLTPPPELKRQVLAHIAEIRQDAPEVEPVPSAEAEAGAGAGAGAGVEAGLPASRVRTESSRARRAARFALAASVAAAVGLGGVAVWQYDRAQNAHHQAQQAQADAARIAAVLAAPDAHAVVGAVGGPAQGARATVVSSHSQDRAVFLTAGLPELPHGQTYQLWFDDAGVMRPAGLVAPGATDQTVLLRGPIARASGMGITVEPAGGSLHPTSAPIALMPFAAT
ncbi:anti-sigma factor [Streptacidiphilus pinicola]|uniref:Regulator of SigK n=1 Tax=Streptacidiphilus pinicola TaxID=2219663 RepID=A0A2X0IUN5_9ACTN|nr:anti-sigma factor [Streptacidiphilus pinicola]RAG87333.1 anti-sigma factor [Streptacidiphilus pinicola]